METTHFTQQTFRLMLDCFARPGTEKQVPVLEKINGIYAETLSVLYTLLDGEASFYALSDNEQLRLELAAWTGGKETEKELADFIVIAHNAAPQDVYATISEAKIGSLIDPQHAATILLEAAGEETTYTLTGPGIQEKVTVSIPFSPAYAELRSMKNKEFPLGVDMIIIRDNGQMLALPRTTVMKEVTSTWPM